MPTTGERIKERREALQYTLQDVSDKTGLSKSTIMRYESGEISSMAADKVTVMAEALECDPLYLMGYSDDLYPERNGTYTDTLDDEAMALLKDLRDQPGMRMLFSAAKGVSKDDLELAAEMIKRMKKESGLD